MLGDDRANRMHRFVTRQPFLHKASHCPDNGIKPFGNLVFHNNMEDRVNVCVREPGACCQVMCFDKVDSFLLVEREPHGRIRRELWVVVLHNGAV